MGLSRPLRMGFGHRFKMIGKHRMDPNLNLNDESMEDWPAVARDAAIWVIEHKNSEYHIQLPEDRKGWLVEQVELRLKAIGEL